MRKYLKKFLEIIFLTFNKNVKLPFFKKILIADKNNWCELDYFKVALLSMLKGYQCKFLKNGVIEKKYTFKFEQEGIRSINHKGINLYSVSVYMICVELQTFINDIDFSNPDHLEVISKWFQKSASFIDHITPYFEKNTYSKVVIQQGYLYDSAITRWICVKRNLEIFAIENTFNKNKMVWDNVSGISVNNNLAANYFWRHRNIIDKKDADKYVLSYLSRIKLNKQDEHLSPDMRINIHSDRKTICFIGQVYTDASVLFGINDFQSPISIVENLVNYCIKNNYNLVIKLHPKEYAGIYITHNIYNSITHRLIQKNEALFKLIQNADRIIYDYKNNYDTYSIIKAADVCITINSQAGLEALLFGKPVITCGKSFYDNLDMVYNAKNVGMLGSLLDNLLNTEDKIYVDKEQVNKFLYIFCEKYCIEKNEMSFVKLIT